MSDPLYIDSSWAPPHSYTELKTKRKEEKKGNNGREKAGLCADTNRSFSDGCVSHMASLHHSPLSQKKCYWS